MKRSYHTSFDNHPSNNTVHGRDQRNVADHYNQVKQLGIKGREDSKIIRLRKFNNWVKSTLIQRYVPRSGTVMDFCGGKGGDIGKYKHARIRELVHVDHAETSVLQAVDRYNNRKNRFSAMFVRADCFGVDLVKHVPWPEDLYFDTVSCQFAMHYAFESEDRVRMMLHNITSRLKPGGYFIGTTLDANVLVRNWRNVRPDPRNPAGLHTFGNQWYKVRFCTTNLDGTENPELQEKKLDPEQPYGIRYYFNLEQAVSDCPEFLVHWPTFVSLASEYGLECELSMNFHEYMVEHHDKQDNMKLINNIRVLDDDRTFPKDQWDIAYLYKCFAFKMKGGIMERPWETRQPPMTRRVEEHDIIHVPDPDDV